MSTLKITDARARELAALEREASDGPWYAVGKVINWTESDGEEYGIAETYDEPNLPHGPCGACGAPAGQLCDCGGEPPPTDDAALIAAARNALPDLLADREAMLAALRRAEAVLAYEHYCELECAPCGLRADIRALLASAEGTRDG